MSGDTKKLIAFNYFGGKFTWVEWLYKFFPPHIHFIDVFCGSMAVTLNKPLSKIDTANDINSDVVNFFRVLREQPQELITLLSITPVAREEFNNCWLKTDEMSDLEKARRFYVRCRQSLFSLGSQHKNKGWHLAVTLSRTNKAETVQKWHAAIEKLEPVVERLMHIQIENKDFREVITKMDFPGAFFYQDPPYAPESRNSKNDYKFDFTETDHRELAELNHQVKGKVMISGYDCKLMRDLYADWYHVKFPIKHNNIRKGAVQECIWMNYNPQEVNPPSLFSK